MVDCSVSPARTKFEFKKLLLISELSAFIVLLFMCVLLSILSPYFLEVTNIINVLRQFSLICIIAIGQQMILISGGVDLTCGVGIGLTGVVAAVLSMSGFDPVTTLIITLMTGIVMGACNGFLVTKFKLNAFITTLGTMSIVRGLALLITGGQPLRFKSPLAFLGGGYIGVIPVSVIIMFVVMIIGHIFIKHTTTGTNLYAIGNNEKSAVLSAIKVNRTKILVFSITGGLVALGGIINSGNVSMADPSAGFGYEMDIVAACVIGGASLFGGHGSIIGVVLGAALMGVMRNGFLLLGISAYWQIVAIGVVIILSVYIDVLRKKNANEAD